MSKHRRGSVASSIVDNVIIVEPASNHHLPGHRSDLQVGHGSRDGEFQNFVGHDVEDLEHPRGRGPRDESTFVFQKHNEGRRTVNPTIIATSVDGRKRRLSHGEGEDDEVFEGDEEDESVSTPSPSTPPDPQTSEQSPTLTAGNTTRRPPTVRFRSRVRIASGLHNHHHHHHRHAHSAIPDFTKLTDGHHGQDLTPTTHPGVSPGSSRSASFSSSISAPLRIHPNCSESGWGPLGMRVSAMANGGGLPLKKCGAVGDLNVHLRKEKRKRRAGMNERTPLLGGGDDDHECDTLEEQVNKEFGTWPGRLLNWHWWWWRLEPIVCCTVCMEDDEEEE